MRSFISDFSICITVPLNKSVNYELALLNKKMDSLSEYLNKLVNSNLPSPQEKIEENISVLRKNLDMKDEKIKKLVETQGTVLNTEAATGDVLYKKVFLKFLQNSQENTCARVSF